MTLTTDPPADVRALMARATGDEKHDGAASSILDAVWLLYDRILRVDPSDPQADGRDRFVLSKGHGPVALYAVLAARGFFPAAWLDRFMQHHGRLGSHPDRHLVPGIEVSTGSLGHGLPIAVGMAQALRARGADEPRVIVLCGDGELNEGSAWEAILLAPYLELGSLTLLVIDNHSSTLPMGSLPERLAAFGWDARRVDGRDHDALEAALRIRHARQPVAVVADIERGR